MDDMTKDDAIRAGGWDPRYAVVRAIVSGDGFAAVVIDPNGDGGTIDLDEYHRGAHGEWIPGSSGGGAGASGGSCSPNMVTAYGRTQPGATVIVDHLGRTRSVTADDEGWWLCAVPSVDGHTLPATLSPRLDSP